MNEVFDIKKTMKERGMVIIIPVYNNAKTISQVISGTKQFCDDIIVVNDGSTDGTKEILEATDNIELISYDQNRGKGFALKQGFKRALKKGFAYAISMDGDMQHLPSEIECLLKENIKKPGTVIIGSRKNLKDFKRGKGSIFANHFSNFWFNFQTWNKIKDTQSGFRLYPIKKMWWLPVITSRYEAELEMLILYSWHFVQINEVDVTVYYPDPENRVSSFRHGKDFLRISVMNTIATMVAFIYGWPLSILRIFLDFFRTLYIIIWTFILVFVLMTPYAFFVMLLVKDRNRRSEYIKRGITILGPIAMLQIRIAGGKGCKASFINDRGEDFKKPAMIICNHQSYFDLVLLQSFTNKLVFLGNSNIWKSRVYGHIVQLTNYLPSSLTISELIPKFRQAIEQNNSIMIFPEGTRSLDCTIGRFHQGAFAIADALDLDILPIIIYGTGKVLPKNCKSVHSGKIHYEIEKRFSKEEYRKIGSHREMASFFRKYCTERYSEVRNKIEQDV